jgi:hypothetical protein
MKIRDKKTNRIGYGDEFNIHSMSEIVVYFKDDVTSDYSRNYDAFIEALGE